MDLGSQHECQGGYCWILDPKLGGSRGYSNALFKLMLDPGAKMGQDSPKSPPRGPQEPSKSCPRASKSPPRGPWGQIFGRILIDFLVDFFTDLTHPQARWRRPAGQLDISAALPLGRAWHVERFSQVLASLNLQNPLTQPSALLPVRQFCHSGFPCWAYGGSSWLYVGLCWPILGPT